MGVPVSYTAGVALPSAQRDLHTTAMAQPAHRGEHLQELHTEQAQHSVKDFDAHEDEQLH